MTGKGTSVENAKFINFNLSAGTYSLDDFKAKTLQQQQDWKPLQIKDLRLVIQDDYKFMASNAIFIPLGIQNNYFENATLIGSRLPHGSYKISLDT